MTFLAPIWLLLFLPFAAIVWRAMRTPPVEASIPGVFLWPSVPQRAGHHGRRPPPAWAIAALAAMAASIVALARPTGPPSVRSISVVVDPAFDVEPAAVWRTLSTSAQAELVVPGQPDVDSIERIRRTARSTDAIVTAAVGRLRDQQRSVVVVGPSHSAFSDVLTVSATRPRVRLELMPRDRSDGGVDVLVRVERQSLEADRVAIELFRGSARLDVDVAFGVGAFVADRVVGLGGEGGEIVGRIKNASASRLGDRAWVQRDDRSAIRVAINGELPPALGRFADAYATARPADGMASTLVTLTNRSGTPGAAVQFGAARGASDMPVRLAPHPAIDGAAIASLPAPTASEPPPDGFEPIAWVDARPIAAARDEPNARAVWLAFDIDVASREAAWVVLLDQAIRWAAGDSGERWGSVTSDEVPREGWRPIDVGDPSVEASPGRYADVDGRMVAVNLPPLKRRQPLELPDEGALARWLDAQSPGPSTSVPSTVAWIAAGLATAAAAMYGRRGLRGWSRRDQATARLDDRAGLS